MAFFSGTIRSSALAMDTGLNVILPYDRPAQLQREPCKALYLLHGLGDNCSAWIRYTSIEAYAREKGIAVIMPEVQRSFYQDMTYGLAYFDYVSGELPGLCAKMFGVGPEREDTYVAGLSMGGYGAMLCGLARPGRYAGCASFSGAVDIVSVIRDHIHDDDDENVFDEFKAALGIDMLVPEGSDLFRLAGKVAALPKEQRPMIYLTCGIEDFLIEDNRRFREHLAALPIDFTYDEWHGGHMWPFWDKSVRKLLELWFPS